MALSDKNFIAQAFRLVITNDVRTWKNAMLDMMERQGRAPRVWCNSSGAYISNRGKITVDHIDPKFRNFFRDFLLAKQLDVHCVSPILSRDRAFSIVPQVSFEPPHERLGEDFRSLHWKRYQMDLVCDPHPRLRLMSRADNARLG